MRARRWEAGVDVPTEAKVVHLIRHGQGFHNLCALSIGREARCSRRLGDIYRDFGRSVDSTGQEDDQSNPYGRPEIVDPPLTAVGREQAKALRPTTTALSGVDLVVVSPLARAVQTAQLALPHLKGKVPWIGHPDVAESSGKNTCDKRRDKAEIVEDFPFVDWALFESEEDNFWTPTRETARSVSDRGYEFLLWLRARRERQVAVATHSAWLFTLLNTCLACDDLELASWFMTGELRSLVLEYEDSA